MAVAPPVPHTAARQLRIRTGFPGPSRVDWRGQPNNAVLVHEPVEGGRARSHTRERSAAERTVGAQLADLVDRTAWTDPAKGAARRKPGSGNRIETGDHTADGRRTSSKLTLLSWKTSIIISVPSSRTKSASGRVIGMSVTICRIGSVLFGKRLNGPSRVWWRRERVSHAAVAVCSR